MQVFLINVWLQLTNKELTRLVHFTVRINFALSGRLSGISRKSGMLIFPSQNSELSLKKFQKNSGMTLKSSWIARFKFIDAKTYSLELSATLVFRTTLMKCCFLKARNKSKHRGLLRGRLLDQ